MLPWECESCSHKEIESPFYTFDNCPKCGSDCFYHGEMIDEEWGVFKENKLIKTFYTKEEAERFENEKNRMFQTCAFYTSELSID